MKNYYRTRQQILNKERTTIRNKKFIHQVRLRECLFSENDNKINYKKLIEDYINKEPRRGIIIRNCEEYKKDENNYENLRKLSSDSFVESKFVKKIFEECDDKKIYDCHDINSDNFFDSEIVRDFETKYNSENNIIINEKDKIKLKSNQNYIHCFTYRHLCSDTGKLSSDIIISIILKAYETYISFYGLKQKGIKCNRARYLGKNEKFNLMFYAQTCKIIKDEDNNTDIIRVTLGRYIAKNYIAITGDNSLVCIKNTTNLCNYKTINGEIIEGNYLDLRLPRKLTEDENRLNLIEVIPLYDGYVYKVNYAYTITRKEEHNELENNNIDVHKNYISVDLGMVNLMTIYDPDGKQYIIKGSYIISLNKSYNDHIAKLQSALMKSQNVSTSKRMRNMLINRSNRIDDYFNKIVRWFVNNYGHKKKIIIGYNTNWKNGVNMGRNNNRKFYRIPYTKLLKKLKDKMELLGIEVILNEESYTSKCDALAKELVQKHAAYLGKREIRGLFSSSTRKLINADLNGAINIMRKYMKNKEKREIQNITGKSIFNPIKVKHKDILKGKRYW